MKYEEFFWFQGSPVPIPHSYPRTKSQGSIVTLPGWKNSSSSELSRGWVLVACASSPHPSSCWSQQYVFPLGCWVRKYHIIVHSHLPPKILAQLGGRPQNYQLSHFISSKTASLTREWTPIVTLLPWSHKVFWMKTHYPYPDMSTDLARLL